MLNICYVLRLPKQYGNSLYIMHFQKEGQMNRNNECRLHNGRFLRKSMGLENMRIVNFNKICGNIYLPQSGRITTLVTRGTSEEYNRPK